MNCEVILGTGATPDTATPPRLGVVVIRCCVPLMEMIR